MALLLGAAVLVEPCGAQPEPPGDYRGAGRRAIEWAAEFVSLGPRPAGSEALRAQAELMTSSLRELRCDVTVDGFVAATPAGALPMRNIVARFGPAEAKDVTVVSGHYDTKAIPGFVGANDGGSSAALLMVLAERLSARLDCGPVWIVFFDGEESIVEWRDGDHTYGSRRLARTWKRDGTAERLRALINVDMIGDKSLRLVYEGNSDARIRSLVWNVARGLGYGQVFSGPRAFIEDDHIEFLKIGVPAVNLIDFDYGPDNSYWHTSEDSLDKLSPDSFATILHVLEAVLCSRLAR